MIAYAFGWGHVIAVCAVGYVVFATVAYRRFHKHGGGR